MTNISPYSPLNALVAAAETQNKFLVWIKMALFTNLQYSFHW